MSRRLLVLLSILFSLFIVGCDLEFSSGEGEDGTWYMDADGDGYGDPLVSQVAAYPPVRYVLDNTDCDDTNILINSEAVEVCDGVDQDCDALTAVLSFPSAVTAHAGNAGDASITTITTDATTLSDFWTVKCLNRVDASTGTLTVTGATYGVQGTVNVGATFDDADVGQFPVSGGAPVRATGTFTFTSPAADFDLQALEYGAGSNSITIELRNPGPNSTVGVNVSGNDIVVDLDTDASGNVTSTSQDVVDAINISPASNGLVTTPTNPVATDATVDALSQTALTGGSGVSPGDSFTFTTTAGCIE